MKTLLLVLFSSVSFFCSAQDITPEELAQKQLDAYNAGDIDKFLEVYSDSVKIFDFPNTLTMQGKENMRQVYGQMFQNTPDLHCTLVNRMVMGNTVIDQESVVFRKDMPPAKAIAIYKIANNKIAEVYFIMPKSDSK